MTWNSEDESTLSSIPRWLIFTGERGQLQPQKDGTWASTYGWTGRPDGRTVSFSDCAGGEIIFGEEPGRRITSLIAQGKAYTLAVYSGAEHDRHRFRSDQLPGRFTGARMAHTNSGVCDRRVHIFRRGCCAVFWFLSGETGLSTESD